MNELRIRYEISSSGVVNLKLGADELMLGLDTTGRMFLYSLCCREVYRFSTRERMESAGQSTTVRLCVKCGAGLAPGERSLVTVWDATGAMSEDSERVLESWLRHLDPNPLQIAIYGSDLKAALALLHHEIKAMEPSVQSTPTSFHWTRQSDPQLLAMCDRLNGVEV